jgi:hypothetical protein
MTEKIVAADRRRAPQRGDGIARGNEKARQRRHADKGQHGEAEQRAQIAGAGQHHEPRDAAPRQRHADAEQEPAYRARRTGSAAWRGSGSRPACRSPRPDHELHREKCTGKAQRPGGHRHQPPAPRHVEHGGAGAERAALGEQAEDQADSQATGNRRAVLVQQIDEGRKSMPRLLMPPTGTYTLGRAIQDHGKGIRAMTLYIIS